MRTEGENAYGMLHLKCFGTLVAAILVVSLLPGLVSAGPDKTGQAIAFAHVAANGGVLSFGGKGTTSVAVVHVAAGGYQITFHGHYPSSLTPGPPSSTANDLIVNATAEGGHFGVANASAVTQTAPVAAPTKTDIIVDVSTWVSNVLIQVDNGFFVTVYFGQP